MNPAFYTFWGLTLEVSENPMTGHVHLITYVRGNQLYSLSEYPGDVRAFHNEEGVLVREARGGTPLHFPAQIMEVRTRELIDTVQVLKGFGIKSKHVNEVMVPVRRAA